MKHMVRLQLTPQAGQDIEARPGGPGPVIGVPSTPPVCRFSECKPHERGGRARLIPAAAVSVPPPAHHHRRMSSSRRTRPNRHRLSQADGRGSAPRVPPH
jgi:hypothetical protein